MYIGNKLCQWPDLALEHTKVALGPIMNTSQVAQVTMIVLQFFITLASK